MKSSQVVLQSTLDTVDFDCCSLQQQPLMCKFASRTVRAYMQSNTRRQQRAGMPTNAQGFRGYPSMTSHRCPRGTFNASNGWHDLIAALLRVFVSLHAIAHVSAYRESCLQSECRSARVSCAQLTSPRDLGNGLLHNIFAHNTHYLPNTAHCRCLGIPSWS